MSTLEIDRGDTVRLRNGETLVVGEVIASYHDSQGDHEGPFISPRGAARDRYPLGDVAEVVERNPHRCSLCGGGVTSKDPERYPFCSGCHYSGAAASSQRAEQLAAIATALDGPEVAVEHTGGGCFWLAVRFAGEEDYYVLTDGEASLPEQPEGGWGYVGLQSDNEASPHYEGTPIRYLSDDDDPGLSDHEAALVIKRHREGKRPYPRRGETRIGASTSRGQSWEQASGFTLNVPADLARRIGPDALFRVEATEEGLLYRHVEGDVRGQEPGAGWLS
jgi:hypothetical protein